MSKIASKETSIPMITALVLLVLSNITFGVMWYMQYSDQQTLVEAVKKTEDSKKTADGLAADAKLEAQILRIMLGIPEEKDKESVASETMRKPLIATKVKQYNDAVAKSFGVDDISKIPDDLKPQIWMLDDKGSAGDPPTQGILPITGNAAKKRDEAIASARAALDDYQKMLSVLNATDAKLKNLQAQLERDVEGINKKFIAAFDNLTKEFDNRKREFAETEEKLRQENIKLDDSNQDLSRRYRDASKKVEEMKKQIEKANKENRKNQDTFQ